MQKKILAHSKYAKSEIKILDLCRNITKHKKNYEILNNFENEIACN